MRLRNSPQTFGLVAQGLHWLIAALIIVQYVLAQMAEGASLFQQLVILARHRAVGMTILGLAALRLWWKLINPRVEPPAGQPRYQHIAASATHALMYFLLFALPLTGWVLSSVADFPVSYFGLFTLPSLMPPREAWIEPLEELHSMLFDLLALTVAVHVLGAIYHHLVQKDGVLKRMVPGWGGGRP